MRPFGVWLFGLTTACLFLTTTDSRACSVCEPGDPLFSKEGASAQPLGSFSFFLETRQSEKKSGALPHHAAADDEHEHGDDEHDEDAGAEEHVHAAGGDRERSDLRETNLYTSLSPLPRLTLTTALPFRSIRIREMPRGEPHETLHNSGLGDASLYATALLWRDRPELPATTLEGRLLLKLPTGKRDERINGVLDPHIQLGTGSWDWGAGLAVQHRFIDGAVFGSVLLRRNGPGALHYRYGDVLLANLAFTSDTRHLEQSWLSALRAGTELNFRHAQRDRANGVDYEHSGGSIFYLTPFVELRLGPQGAEHSPWLRLSPRLPLGNGGLYGDQSEGVVYSAGLRLAF